MRPSSSFPVPQVNLHSPLSVSASPHQEHRPACLLSPPVLTARRGLASSRGELFPLGISVFSAFRILCLAVTRDLLWVPHLSPADILQPDLLRVSLVFLSNFHSTELTSGLPWSPQWSSVVGASSTVSSLWRLLLGSPRGRIVLLSQNSYTEANPQFHRKETYWKKYLSMVFCLAAPAN